MTITSLDTKCLLLNREDMNLFLSFMRTKYSSSRWIRQWGFSRETTHHEGFVHGEVSRMMSLWCVRKRKERVWSSLAIIERESTNKEGCDLCNEVDQSCGCLDKYFVYLNHILWASIDDHIYLLVTLKITNEVIKSWHRNNIILVRYVIIIFFFNSKTYVKYIYIYLLLVLVVTFFIFIW